MPTRPKHKKKTFKNIQEKEKQTIYSKSHERTIMAPQLWKSI